MIMYQYWSINCNKYATLMQDIDNRENMYVGSWMLIGAQYNYH